MISLPPEPHTGDRVSAETIRQIIRAIRSARPIAGTGMKVSSGPNGSVLSCEPAVRAKKTASVLDGCFVIKSYTPDYEGAQPYLAVMNRFYRIGHLFKELTAATPPAIDDLVSAESPILALVVTADVAEPEASLESFEDFAALASEGEDESKAIYPLYLCRFNDDEEYAGIEIDFRNMPDIDMTEG